MILIGLTVVNVCLLCGRNTPKTKSKEKYFLMQSLANSYQQTEIIKNNLIMLDDELLILSWA